MRLEEIDGSDAAAQRVKAFKDETSTRPRKWVNSNSIQPSPP